jgi:DNA-binding MarR family transcriptional regulator
MEATSTSETAESWRQAPIWLLSKAGFLFSTRANKILLSMGMNRHRFAVLFSLSHVNSACQTELSALADMDRSDMTSVLQTLESEGLVERRFDPMSRSRKLAFLTEAGRLYIDAACQAQAEIETEVFGVLPAKERRQFLLSLQRVVEALDAAGMASEHV